MGAGPPLKGHLEGETDVGLMEMEEDIPNRGTAYAKSRDLSQICFPEQSRIGCGSLKGCYHLKSKPRRTYGR